ncbi:porin family protein [Ohtaekwangia koreensis]|uniref:Outer membrane protein W n=1 Tax=Ohtaekwangia koreensis TaxID=688867 RepID=A0A1T5KT69_9BACT|nr:porin family protein [Ohtaekwangia koreensis]SKC66830.1 Outer membrane protein W [Ohtaekwangia koreensis]
MKKLLTILLSLGAFMSTVYAQTSQGNLSFGGAIGYTSETEEDGGEDDKTSQFRFAPSVSYFIADNLAIGADLSLVTQKRDDGFGGDDKYTEIAVGPLVRYYMFTSNDKFAFYGQAGFRFGSGKYEPDGLDETKSSSFDLYISPGFSYFFNEHWALDLQLQGISYRTEDPNTDGDADDDKTKTFTFGVDSFNPSLGFRYFLGN